MKIHSRRLDIGLAAMGGLMALYLLGGLILYIDFRQELLLLTRLPEPIAALVIFLYRPLHVLM